MKVKGVITIDAALKAHKEGLPISEVLIKDISTTTPDTLYQI